MKSLLLSATSEPAFPQLTGKRVRVKPGAEGVRPGISTKDLALHEGTVTDSGIGECYGGDFTAIMVRHDDGHHSCVHLADIEIV